MSPVTYSAGRRVDRGFQARIVAVVVGVVTFVVLMVAVFLDTRAHDRLAAQLCNEIPIVASSEFAADLHRLGDGPTHDLAFAYRADVLQYGPDALVTQKAFDSLARQCARD